MMSAGHDEDTIVVEEVFEEDVDGMEVILHDPRSSEIRFEDDQDRQDGDAYGGMSLEMYENIVEFKKSGVYPRTLDIRQDRSAMSHWRSRCSRFLLADDNETLLYYNPTSTCNNETAKVVVKKGEVCRVIERIHELIGHLGQKRTQMVVLKKLYWRSVREDVKTYINNCAFCNQKKLEGKKILKAPVDISSAHFDINIDINAKADPSTSDRLTFALIGYNEHDVQNAAMTRMTSYTFKETAVDLRGNRVTRKPDFLTLTSSHFRRQPYIKRNRFGPYTTSYVLPFSSTNKREEADYLIYDPRGQQNTYDNVTEEYENTEEIDVSRPSTSSELVEQQEDHQHEQQAANLQRESPINVEVSVPQEHAVTHHPSLKVEERDSLYQSTSSASGTKRSEGRREAPRTNGYDKNKSYRNFTGMAQRYSMAVNDADKLDLSENAGEVLTPIESAQSRPEMLGLAPILLMPSTDSDVVQLQKELLTRQLRIQALQEKVLQSQYESMSMRIPIARYEEIDQRGDEMILEDDEDVNNMGQVDVMGGNVQVVDEIKYNRHSPLIKMN